VTRPHTGRWLEELTPGTVIQHAISRTITDFQTEVTRLFFSLPASKGFLLAGGGALLANGLTARPT